ncbi:MAG: glycosyltransferase [Chloroflexi bacterium]|nr:glycosyltransferase [Chloroflexota bacterium]
MNIVLSSSSGNCGIYECAQIMQAGFESLGHRVRYIGVERQNAADLRAKISQVADDDQLVIFEYEPGIFKLQPLVRAMAALRMRRKQVYLSLHELEISKFPEYHQALWRFNEPAWRRSWRAPFWLLRGMADVAYRYATLRIYLHLLGTLSNRIIVHSPRLMENVVLITANQSKVRYTPLAVKPILSDRNAMRRKLGLPLNCFAFIVLGFLFRRKRITDVIRQLPEGAELWVVGTTSPYDPGYLEEIEACVAQNGKQAQVRIIQDYNVEPYMVAADVAVLYYLDIFQSAVVSQAMGAGKPCILSDLPGFAEYRRAAMVVETLPQLRQAMLDIQKPEEYQRLVGATAQLRDEHSPEKIALSYLR